MSEKRPIPFLLGLRAARANLLPGLFVQALIVALVLAYYLHPATESVLNMVGEFKKKNNFGFAIVATAFAGAIIPEMLKIAFFQKGRITKGNLRFMLWLIPFWGFQGFMVECLYRLQAFMFGSTADVGTVVSKVCFDEFIFNPFFAGPLNCMFYDLVDRGFTWKHFTSNLSREFLMMRIVPTLIATWMFWIPVITAIYALPSLLQVPLFTLVLTIWTLILAYMNSRRASTHEPPQVQAVAEVTSTS